MKSVNIVGAGLSGLTLARYLSKSGKFDVKLFDSSNTLSLKADLDCVLLSSTIALDKMGFGEAMKDIVHPIRGIDLYSKNKHLGCTSIDHMNESAEFKSISKFPFLVSITDRNLLYNTLSKSIPDSIIHFNKNFESLTSRSDGSMLTGFDDGSEMKSDIVIGCENKTFHKIAFGIPEAQSDLCAYYGESNVDRSVIGDKIIRKIGANSIICLCPSIHPNKVLFYVVFSSKRLSLHDDLQKHKQHVLGLLNGIQDEVIDRVMNNISHINCFHLSQPSPSIGTTTANAVCLPQISNASCVGIGADQSITDAYLLGKFMCEEKSFEDAKSRFLHARKQAHKYHNRVFDLIKEWEMTDSWTKALMRDQAYKIGLKSSDSMNIAFKFWKDTAVQII
ncbi:salicylate hydroxylase [Acrasis kona]|uniref:Salicylate hydroxylase n=1 Tax=Acrasis kona TaxID=1008807 RepID=A0AAW2ZC07_9EUKA